MSAGEEFFKRVGSQVSRKPVGAVEASQEAPPESSKALAQHVGRGGGVRWTTNGDAYWSVGSMCKTLPAGVYGCRVNNDLGPYVVPEPWRTDGLLELPDHAMEETLADFEKFWTLGPAFTKRDFLHKRGVMIWGPPGGGKTCLIALLAARLVKQMKGVVLKVDQPHITTACLALIRKIEPKRPLVTIMEDLDALVVQHGEPGFLSFLDGEMNVDGILHIATTNYPERLDRRFVDRPSRFDTIRYVGMPSAAAREAYLVAKAPDLAADGELREWVKRSDGFSLAHLKEMIVAVKCFGQSLEEVVARLRAMTEDRPASDHAPDRPQVGFAGQVPATAEGHAERLHTLEDDPR